VLEGLLWRSQRELHSTETTWEYVEYARIRVRSTCIARHVLEMVVSVSPFVEEVYWRAV